MLLKVRKNTQSLRRFPVVECIFIEKNLVLHFFSGLVSLGTNSIKGLSQINPPLKPPYGGFMGNRNDSIIRR
jgi:hypothetical protein